MSSCNGWRSLRTGARCPGACGSSLGRLSLMLAWDFGLQVSSRIFCLNAVALGYWEQETLL